MASVVITMDAREAKLFQAQQKIYDQQAKLNAKFDEGGKTGEKASQRVVTGFDKATVSLRNHATVITTITAGIGAMASAYAQMEEEQRKVIANAQKIEVANRRNLQLAGSAGDFQKSNAQSDALAVKYGLSREQARDIFFQSESGGFQDSREFIARASGVVDPSTAATIATKFPQMFKGVTPEEAIKLTGFAAKNSPLNFEQMAAAAPTTSQGMSMLGASMEESLAAQSVLAKRFKGNGEEVATALRGFTTSAGIDPRFAGKGFLGAFQAMQGLPEAERKKFLGSSQELNMGYQIISEEFANIVQATQDNVAEMQRIRSGGGLLANQISISENDPMMAAMKESIRAQVKAEMAGEQRLGVSSFRSQAAASYAEAEMLSRASFVERTVDSGLKQIAGDIPVIGGFISNFLPDSIAQSTAKGLASFGMDPQTAGQVGAQVSTTIGGEFSALGQLLRIAEKQTKAAESMERSASAMAGAANQAGAKAMAATAGSGF